jgi:hypothetical protein
MMRLRIFIGCLLLFTASASAQSPVRFQQDVRPLLSDRCFSCHGPDDEHREAELRLDTRDGALAERDGRRAIVPGSLKDSSVWERITSSDPDLRMPPADSGKELTAAEIALLKRWIEQGADWSEHWAYVPPEKVDPPAVADPQWSVHPVDAFIAARLAEAGRRPSPEADRVTLIRRVTFDLTGLPPTPDEVRAFVDDSSPQAWERLIDRLLATDAYGERMAMYWLDLVRFADTVGYHGDQEHHISPYRDWVIDAFIGNMPFDRFTHEQLAGDLLPEAGTDQKIATGYNRLLQTSHEGGVQAKEYLAMYAADRMRNLSGVWMGATLGCAQCHSHKFDPYTLRDFYSMVAFFADVDEAAHLRKGSDATPTVRAPEMVVLTKRERARIAELEARIRELADQLQRKDLPADQRAKTEAGQKALQAERDRIEKSARRTMITVSIAPREIRVLPRGNWLDDSGPVVVPAIPAFLGKLDTGDRRATRLDLARWLTDAERGSGLLTARVQANRFWYLLFGAGLSRSLDDFGGQGEPPSHPELLDWLAHEFVRSGWDVKHMLKLIALSHTYRQQSVPLDNVDPENRLFGRQGRFRLPAEMIRDTALSVSGLLVREIGGPSVRPYQPAGYYRHLNFPTRDYKPDTDSRQWRRGLYVHWQRQFLHPMLKAFDAPRREECAAQRTISNTPLASLTLLNDPTFVEAARALAAQLLRSELRDLNDDQRLQKLFQLVVSRDPDEYEAGVLKELLNAARADFKARPEAAEQLLSTGLAPLPAGNATDELAAWTMVCRAALNTGETWQRR